MADTFPYQRIPKHQFWGTPELSKFSKGSFHKETRFQLSPSDLVASGGSCFAYHIARYLQINNFHYFFEEKAPPWLNTQEIIDYQYTDYSARYGNIYSTLQLRQLLEQAMETLRPIEEAWCMGDRFVDPFRPRIQPGGFKLLEDLKADRKQHLTAVKKMFQTIDVFIFTVGLTEVWLSHADGVALPMCPGKDFGSYDAKKYSFKNLDIHENIEHLSSAIDLMTELNPQIKIILTLSPVPLVATLEEQHVLHSTILSKSILRTAIEEVRKKHANVDYFAAYEMLSTAYLKTHYFEEDRRSVTPEGVKLVMDVFFKEFTTNNNNNLQIKKEIFMPPSEDPQCDEEALLSLIKEEFI